MNGPLRVFAVEDRAVQLAWRQLPSREATLELGDHRVDLVIPPPAWVHHRRMPSRRLGSQPGGPGVVVVEGLDPDTTYPIRLRPAGGRPLDGGKVRTLPPPPGRLLSRFATVSDTHIGERRFGALGTIVDVQPRHSAAEPYPLRCARAALAEARAWGAELLVVKGDLTARGLPAEFAAVDALLADAGMASAVQLGNHDVRHHLDLAALLPHAALAGRGASLAHDLPGVRVVLGDSTIFRDRPGHLAPDEVETLAGLAADAPGPAVIALHHPPRRWPLPVVYPPGLRRPASRSLTAALQAANPATMVLAGHTHRNRTYRVDGTLVAEVGSTKDHPGVWAGYAVHEGGIRQVVRRIGRPDVVAWTEATGAALGGLWGAWSPGRLTDRCWWHRWPD